MRGKNAYDGALFLNIEHKVSQTYPLALNTRRMKRVRAQFSFFLCGIIS